MDQQKMIRILEQELVVALGCTEPVAIALASATAKKYIKKPVQEIIVQVSGNILKNAKAVGIPGMKSTGIDFATAIGFVAGNPDKKLEVLENLTAEDETEALKLIQTGRINVAIAESPKKLYIEITAKSDEEQVKVVIADNHSNITLIEVNGKAIYQGGCENIGIVSDQDSLEEINIAEVFEFITKVDLGQLDLVKKSIELNKAIGLEGLENPYGLSVGKTIRENVENGYLSDDLATRAMSLAAAGSDARMAGSTMPVMANTGSGNQGIAVTLPVVAVAEKLNVDQDTMIRAVALSHLLTIHIKSKFGRLSALCGVTAAGMGASGAIAFLLGGGLIEVEAAVQNTIGNITGMICDGAKAGCAMKVSTCSNVAVQSALLAMNQKKIQATDGFIHNNVEKSIESFCKLGNQGTLQTDQLILELMLETKE
ncbi:serine dehydratase subunit alpha family protein [Bacillus sp. CGMCC 1.16607]|uniref:L-cysteine desulfidase family protein n=1 Tax=Bacillus sp. CGMCC 1.16607 TaxID=3351842 RepID=UPI003642EEF2